MSGRLEGHIAHEDNLSFMNRLATGSIDLIYIDPPFFTRKNHRQGNGKHRLDDSWAGGLDTYLDFLRSRLEQMHRLLKPSGTIYVHLDWHAVHYVKLMLDEIFGYKALLNEIIWSYRTGGRNERWFARKHDTILSYARRIGTHKFHVIRGGRYRTDGMNYDEEGRPYKSTRAGRLYFHPNGPALTDVWDIPFLSTVSKERTRYPTQKPEQLLERIIMASSDRDDLVADFFCGSGTTLVVAKRLGRRWLGCDAASHAVKLTLQRLAKTHGL